MLPYICEMPMYTASLDCWWTSPGSGVHRSLEGLCRHWQQQCNLIVNNALAQHSAEVIVNVGSQYTSSSNRQWRIVLFTIKLILISIVKSGHQYSK